jgi:hypothetical protein
MAKEGFLFTLLLIIFSICATAYFGGGHSYGISVPLQIEVSQGSTVQTPIVIHPELFYVDDVSFRVKSVPPHISVNFEPKILKSDPIFNFISLGKSVSTLYVSADKETPPGEYWIIVESEGSVGKYENKLTIKVTK